MTPFQTLVLIALPLFALWAGSVVARKSAREAQVKSGAASVFHYLAACIATIIPLSILSASFVFRTVFAQTAVICLGLFAVEFGLLAIYAVFQRAKSTPI